MGILLKQAGRLEEARERLKRAPQGNGAFHGKEEAEQVLKQISS